MTTETAVVSTTTTTNTAEDLDFLGNGSLADIMSKMGDIDKVLSEISDIDSTKKNQDGTTSTTAAPGTKTAATAGASTTATSTSATTTTTTGRPVGEALPAAPSSYDESASSFLSDGDEDDEAGDIADLQGELQAAETSQRQAMEERMKAAELKQRCLAGRTTSYGTWEVESESYGGKVVHKSIIVSLTKPSQDSPVGISMKTSKGVTRIVAISDDGLLAGSGLTEKQRLVQINGTTLSNARHARHLIQSTPGEITIVALCRSASNGQ